MKNVLVNCIHQLHGRSLQSAYKRAMETYDSPALTQHQNLEELLYINRDSDYVKAYLGKESTGRLKSVDTFRSRFPIVTFEDLKPWFDRINSPDNNILTKQKTLCWEPTSGSSQAKKWIPYNQALLTQFNSSINPWLVALYKNYQGIKKGSHYWSVSMANRDSTQSEIPVGLPDDSHYLGPLARLATRCIMSVPASVKHEPSDEAWKWKTAFYLLSDQSLAMISVWSPTFLTVICEFILEHWPRIYTKLPKQRQRALKNFCDLKSKNFESLWPNLSLISCWTDGPALPYAQNLRNFFPTVPIQGKGLLTTEGVISVPIQAHPGHSELSQGAVAAIGSHFYEFIPEEENTESKSQDIKTVLAHELEIGRRYTPVITTAGGLYRYRISDTLECSGYYHQTPLLKFIGKNETVSDIAGEKLHHSFIQHAVESTLNKTGLQISFLLVTPPKSIPGSYTVFLESSSNSILVTAFLKTLEAKFCENFHYQQCRTIGQLNALNHQVINRGWQIYQDTQQKAGIKLGDIKPSFFNDRFDWKSIFSNNPVNIYNGHNLQGIH